MQCDRVAAPCRWCAKKREPTSSLAANVYSEKLSVVKYDVEGENNENLKVEMLLQGVVVRGLPTLLLYGEGVPLATRTCAITEKDLKEWLDCNRWKQRYVREAEMIK